MLFATQAQMADGQEELVVKKVARRLMIESLLSMDGLMTRKAIIAEELRRHVLVSFPNPIPHKITCSVVVNFVSERNLPY